MSRLSLCGKREMKFRTEIEIERSDLRISHHTKMLVMGSCFAQNIGTKLCESKFDVLLNPFGILYNPISIAQAIEYLIEKKQWTEDDFFFDQGLYHSFSHHGSFSHHDSEQCLQNTNIWQQKATLSLHDANILLVTFGTSYVYEHLTSGKVVANCHKRPSSEFKRYRLSVEAIVEKWIAVIDKAREANPKLSVVFTVSPIRHLRDGAHDNQLSKSTLLLAIDQIEQRRNDVHYFPSYEILLDDLRDYRFYDQDMVHPNALTVEYIWNIFAETFFSEQTRAIAFEWLKLKKAIDHRPINQETDQHTHFLKQTLLKLNEFSSKYPFVCVNSEINDLNDRIQDQLKNYPQ